MDPIDVEIFNHLFQSIAEEMGTALMRAAFSSNIKERRDHSCALFDAEGRLVAQAAHIPVHLGSMPGSVAAALDFMRSAPLRPSHPDGSVILNDPYAGGTHLPDLTLVTPVYGASAPEPLFYVANRAHHADVGGISAGSLPMSRHIDDEGIRLEPQWLTQDVVDRFSAASRTPAERRGDLAAQRAANRLGVRRTRELIEKYGAQVLQQRTDALIDYAETLMRSVLVDVKDGVFTAADVIESDGMGNRNLTIAVRLEIDGDSARIDFSDTTDQTDGPLNAVRAITDSAVFYVFRCLGATEAPTNAGCVAPLTIITRKGSLVDARWPAAVAAGNVETSQRIVDVLLQALSQACPDRIPACSTGSMNNVCMGGKRPDGSPFVYYETIGGGAGAHADGAGADGLHTHMTNTLNTPVEAFEHTFPIRLTRYHLRAASGGRGAHRGGEGVLREYEFREPTEVTLIAERHRCRPPGAAGGEAGQPGAASRLTESGWQSLPSKWTLTFESGQRLRVETAGGGGYGNPAKPD